MLGAVAAMYARGGVCQRCMEQPAGAHQGEREGESRFSYICHLIRVVDATVWKVSLLSLSFDSLFYLSRLRCMEQPAGAHEGEREGERVRERE
jgi:hypothetical protein